MFNWLKRPKPKPQDPWDIGIQRVQYLDVSHFHTVHLGFNTLKCWVVCYPNFLAYTEEIERINVFMQQKKILMASQYQLELKHVTVSDFFIDRENFYIDIEVILERFKRAAIEYLSYFQQPCEDSVIERNKQITWTVAGNLLSLLSQMEKIDEG